MKIVICLLFQIIVCVWSTNNTSDVTFEEATVIRNLDGIGLVTRITAQGFQYAAQVGADTLYKKLEELTDIPDLSTQQNGVNITLGNLSIVDFSRPIGHAELIPDHGIRWILLINEAVVYGFWRYATTGWFSLQDEGNFQVTLSETTLNITAEITRNKKGGLAIAVSDCESEINFEMNLGSWIYNMVASLAKPFLGQTLEDKLCEIATEVIRVDAMSGLNSLPVSVTVHHYYEMDYRIREPPYITSDYMELYHKGEMKWKGDSEETPFLSKTVPPLIDIDKMLYLQISDHLFNSYCRAAFMHNMLSFDVTDYEIPGHLLKTSCREGEACIGTILPVIGLRYPNETVRLSMANRRAPHWLFDEIIQLTLKGCLSFDIHLRNGSTVNIFKLDMDLSAHMSALIENSKVFSEIIDLNFTTSKIRGKIFQSNFNFTNLLRMVDTVVRNSIIPKINEQGRIGLPLILMDGASLQSTSLKVGKRCLIIGTNFHIDFI